MVSLAGKTALVTGSTDGIGRQTALDLARLGAKVYIHGRSLERGTQALTALQAELPTGQFALTVGNLASLQSVRSMAHDFASQIDHLDILINNAGVKPTTRQVSEDGYELTFAVNHLAHFLLTNLLLPLIRRAPQGRVITVSSVSHYRGTMNFKDLQLAHGWDSYTAYGQSKLANVLFAFALAERVTGSAITSNALHPGVVSTKLLVEGFGAQGSDSLSEGAATSVYLASALEVAQISGRFFQDSHLQDPAPAAHNHQWQTELWSVSAELTHFKEG